MTPKIVVLGAGYSGLAAAKLAAKWTSAHVTLVNANDRFVERVRLHQLAAGQQLRELPLADLVRATGVELVIDRVTSIDAEARIVHAGREIPYDVLVYALGSQADLESVPGVREHAFTVATFDEALRLRKSLSGRVAVAGGGLTGIEAASELAGNHSVQLVTSGPLGRGLSERGRDYLRRTFTRLGVSVLENASVTSVDATGLTLTDGSRVDADTVVWTAGFRVSDLARSAGFAVDKNGRLEVDLTFRSTSHPEVYGIGDAAAILRADGTELRMACATGIPSAQKAVRGLAATLSGRTPKPLRFKYFNQCISLGRKDGLIQFVHQDDSPRPAILTGRAAAIYKEAIVRGTILFERNPVIPASL
jgi:NADH dehydrogenase FAD-containing subunit